jgi:hypothetical protein
MTKKGKGPQCKKHVKDGEIFCTQHRSGTIVPPVAQTNPKTSVAIQAEKGEFTYQRGGIKPNRKINNVLSVQFDIGRYGILTYMIQFTDPVSELDAIEAAEDWHNHPLSKEEVEILSKLGDIHPGELATEYKFRYEALGNCTLLDAIERSGSAITLVCGS